MALIIWDRSLSVGVAEFDSQHQTLIKLINELNDAMLKGQGRLVLGGIVAELKKYTQSHFTYEEKVLMRIAYPQIAVQVAEHKSFVEKLAGFEKELSEGNTSLSVTIINFLSAWLRSHILGEDAKYMAHCQANGVK